MLFSLGDWVFVVHVEMYKVFVYICIVIHNNIDIYIYVYLFIHTYKGGIKCNTLSMCTTTFLSILTCLSGCIREWAGWGEVPRTSRTFVKIFLTSHKPVYPAILHEYMDCNLYVIVDFLYK